MAWKVTTHTKNLQSNLSYLLIHVIVNSASFVLVILISSYFNFPSFLFLLAWVWWWFCLYAWLMSRLHKRRRKKKVLLCLNRFVVFFFLFSMEIFKEHRGTRGTIKYRLMGQKHPLHSWKQLLPKGPYDETLEQKYSRLCEKKKCSRLYLVKYVSGIYLDISHILEFLK